MNSNHHGHLYSGGGPNLNLLDNVLLAAGFQATDQPSTTRPVIIPQYTPTLQPTPQTINMAGRIVQSGLSHHQQGLPTTAASGSNPVQVIVYQQDGQPDNQPVSFKIEANDQQPVVSYRNDQQQPISFKIPALSSNNTSVITSQQQQQLLVQHGQGRQLVDEQGRQLVDEQGRQLIVDEHGRQLLIDEQGGTQLVVDEHGRQLIVDEHGRQLVVDNQGRQLLQSAAVVSSQQTLMTQGSGSVTASPTKSLAEKRKDIVAQAMQDLQQGISSTDTTVSKIMQLTANTATSGKKSNDQIEQATTSSKKAIEGAVKSEPKDIEQDIKPVVTTSSTTTTPTKQTPTSTQQKRPYQRTVTSSGGGRGRKPADITPTVQILEDEDDGVTCRMCLASFWYKGQLWDHLKSTHAITDPEAHEREYKENKLRKIREAKEAEVRRKQQMLMVAAKKQREERERQQRAEAVKNSGKKASSNSSPSGNRPSFQYKDGVFVCDVCKKSFKAGHEMVTHWKTHIKSNVSAAGSAGAGTPGRGGVRGRGRGIAPGRGGGRGRGRVLGGIIDLESPKKQEEPKKPILLKIRKDKVTSDGGSSDESDWEPEPEVEESDWEPEPEVLPEPKRKAARGGNSVVKTPVVDNKPTVMTKSGRKVKLKSFMKDIDSDSEFVDTTQMYTPSRSQIQGRKGRCNKCVNCKREECGTCKFCMDKPKRGGANVLRKACVDRKKCIGMKQKKDSESEYVTEAVPNRQTKSGRKVRAPKSFSQDDDSEPEIIEDIDMDDLEVQMIEQKDKSGRKRKLFELKPATKSSKKKKTNGRERPSKKQKVMKSRTGAICSKRSKSKSKSRSWSNPLPNQFTPDNTQYLCSICFKIFESNRILRDHIKEEKHTNLPGVKVEEGTVQNYPLKPLRIDLMKVSNNEVSEHGVNFLDGVDFDTVIQDIILTKQSKKEKTSSNRRVGFSVDNGLSSEEVIDIDLDEIINDFDEDEVKSNIKTVSVRIKRLPQSEVDELTSPTEVESEREDVASPAQEESETEELASPIKETESLASPLKESQLDDLTSNIEEEGETDQLTLPAELPAEEESETDDLASPKKKCETEDVTSPAQQESETEDLASPPEEKSQADIFDSLFN